MGKIALAILALVLTVATCTAACAEEVLLDKFVMAFGEISLYRVGVGKYALKLGNPTSEKGTALIEVSVERLHALSGELENAQSLAYQAELGQGIGLVSPDAEVTALYGRIDPGPAVGLIYTGTETEDSIGVASLADILGAQSHLSKLGHG